MATYSKKELLTAQPSQIEAIADAICDAFRADDFEVNVDTLMSGGKDISITKGNVFKAVLGMRSALKVTLTPQTEGVLFEANVGIFGQQAIPTVISMFFFWPVLLTQIWGLIEQSALDDRALEVAKKAIGAPSGYTSEYTPMGTSVKFCTHCGAKIPSGAKFCSECGAKVESC